MLDGGIHEDQDEEHFLADDDDEEEIEKQLGKKRQFRRAHKKAMEKQIKDELREKVESYYSGNYYTKPSSYFAFQMLKQTMRDDVKDLWLWILGSTSCYLQNKIPDEMFRIETSEMQNLVFDKCRFDKSKLQYVENDEGEQYEIETDRLPPGMIASNRELNLYMLRFWNLYDSMFYSNYMTVKLKLWHEEGYKQLERLIARFGVPIKEAR